ncbi:MAG TPA: hypothetical protein PKI03_17135 [Pseudomonadota bacterium]|nr:hypothetical protein [Pseudomonadota bacterium]
MRAARNLRRLILQTALVGLSSLTGCFAPVAQRCPDCTELTVAALHRIPSTANRLYILIPGLLGYGWEWNPAQIVLARHPEVAVVVYSWQPWRSVARSGEELGRVLRRVDRVLPLHVRDVTVIAHSAAGMVALQAAADLGPPHRLLRRPLRIVAVGAPLAGMGFYPDPPDLRNTPLPMVLGGRFTHWPTPAPGVRIDVFPTGPDDPVMRPIGSHNPADPRVLPPGTHFRPLPTDLGHNSALGWLCQLLLDEEPGSAVPSPPLALPFGSAVSTEGSPAHGPDVRPQP